MAIKLMDGCSDDGFEYFSRWLVANGKERYEKALADPSSVPAFYDGIGDCEALSYAPVLAFEKKSGKDFFKELEKYEKDNHKSD